MALPTSKQDLVTLIRKAEDAIQALDTQDIFENESAHAGALEAAHTLASALAKPTDVAMSHVFEVSSGY